MKNFNPRWIYGLLLSLSFGWISSCSEEIVVIEQVDRTELDSIDNLIVVTTEDLTDAKIAKDALKRRVDSLNKVLEEANTVGGENPDVVYTVQVIDGGQSAVNGRAKSLSNAVVTVSQGSTSTELTTDETGMVTFHDMEDGIISVTVEIANYADAYLIVDLRDNGADPDNTNASYRNASTQVMLFPTAGNDVFTISGAAYYDVNTANTHTNAQNDPNHPFTGAQIYETVPVGTTFSIACAPTSIPLNHTRPGKILQAVYAGLERVATTTAGGNYSVDVPAVLLSNGGKLFNYTGPHVVTAISGTQTTSTGSLEQVWLPGAMWPTTLGQMTFYPGGTAVTDVYFFPN